jgi:methionyl-tRNA synthetase
MNKPFFVTTPIYYVNAKPHIGHAYTTVAADVFSRFKKLEGSEVFFSTGTDEHGLKIQREAEKTGKNPKEFADEIVSQFQDLWKKLNIGYTRFIRTTDEKHKEAVQKVLQALYDSGVIYKGFYEGLYCVGCEQFKMEDELVGGKCPDHNLVPELVKEDAYLMKMTELQKELVEKIESGALFITPAKYKKETLSFLKSEALKDISISRKNVSWGIPLPFDTEHTTYVWVDAFLNYLTVLDWSGDKNTVPAEWPADVQFIGKDILRVHSTIWPILLLHLGIALPKTLLTHGHILAGGKKMSKTLGNTIAIDEMLEKFGTDGTRYLLMSAGTFGEDVDLTMERMTEKYNADLANGLGNLVSRVMKLAEQMMNRELGIPARPARFAGATARRAGGENRELPQDFVVLLNEYKFNEALGYIWNIVRAENKYIDDEKPWELVKNDQEKFETVMKKLLDDLAIIAELLASFLPETSAKLLQALQEGKTEPLFKRI